MGFTWNDIMHSLDVLMSCTIVYYTMCVFLYWFHSVWCKHSLRLLSSWINHESMIPCNIFCHFLSLLKHENLIPSSFMAILELVKQREPIPSIVFVPSRACKTMRKCHWVHFVFLKPVNRRRVVFWALVCPFFGLRRLSKKKEYSSQSWLEELSLVLFYSFLGLVD